MNEVKVNQSSSPVLPETASSKVVDSVRTIAVGEVAKAKPVEAAKETGDNVVAESIATLEQVSQAVAQMNEFVQNEQRDLRFSVHEATGSTVVKVTDRSSGELIRQIPNEEFLQLAESASAHEQVNLINATG